MAARLGDCAPRLAAQFRVDERAPEALRSIHDAPAAAPMTAHLNVTARLSPVDIRVHTTERRPWIRPHVWRRHCLFCAVRTALSPTAAPAPAPPSAPAPAAPRTRHVGILRRLVWAWPCSKTRVACRRPRSIARRTRWRTWWRPWPRDGRGVCRHRSCGWLWRWRVPGRPGLQDWCW